MRSLVEMDRLDYLRFGLIIAIAITGYLLLLRWQADYGKPINDVPVKANITENGGEAPVLPSGTAQGISKNTLPPIDAPSLAIDSGLPVAPKMDAASGPQNLAISNTTQRKLITVSTDVLNLQIDLLGGDVYQASLPKYPESHESTKGFELLSSDSRYYVAQTGVLNASTGQDLDEQSRPLFQSAQNRYVLQGEQALEVVLYFENDAVSAEKIFVFQPGQYEFSVQTRVTNKTSDTWYGSFFGQIQRDESPDPSASTGGFGLPTFNGAAYWGPEKRYNKLDFDDLKDSFKTTHSGGWVAWVQHYFLSAWIPEQDKEHIVTGRKTNKGYAISFTESKPVGIAPNQTATFQVRGYFGPKVEKQLGEVADGLNLAVDYGFLFMISKLLFQILSFIQGFVGNWGISIILLTLFVKALFLWPSAISYKSMARMRKLQPQLTRLKDEYGQDRQRMSQEMIKLYQKEKVNPFGGCLPVLMQMPVFIALYWALLESVELRQAPFYGWIQDLSVMDPYFILPLLMGVSMYIQTSLNPTPPDPTQAKVMKFMPVMFTVFFLFFPAGLVLYWLTNNILSIIQQWYITRRIEAS